MLWEAPLETIKKWEHEYQNTLVYFFSSLRKLALIQAVMFLRLASCLSPPLHPKSLFLNQAGPVNTPHNCFRIIGEIFTFAKWVPSMLFSLLSFSCCSPLTYTSQILWRFVRNTRRDLWGGGSWSCSQRVRKSHMDDILLMEGLDQALYFVLDKCQLFHPAITLVVDVWESQRILLVINDYFL